MLRVMNSRSFQSKDKSKTYHTVDIIDEDGNIAVDVFVDAEMPKGTVVVGVPYIKNHKVYCSVVPAPNGKQ